MKILLNGYIDRNLGDDLMLSLAAKGLDGHELYINSENIKIPNVQYTNKTRGFDYSLKVIGSGFLLHNNTGLIYRAREISAERKSAEKTAAIGCSLDKFKNKAAERIIQKQLSGYELITVRDESSYQYIKKHIPNVVCKKYPDIVFSLPEEMIPNNKSDGRLGISVHSSVSSKVLAETADEYIEKKGRKVSLLCFNTGSENDVKTALEVLDIIRNKDMTEIVRYETIPQMLAEMRRCDVILGVRLHSVILSARMGIPFVPVAYSDKMTGVLKEINYGGEIYNTSVTADVLIDNVFSPYPFELDKNIVTAAENHIKFFRELLK